MPKIMVGARVPQEWADKLTEIAKSEGKRQAQVIYQAIANYLGKNASKDSSAINELQRRMSELEEKLTA